MKNEGALGDRKTRKFQFLERRGRDCRNFRPVGDVIRSDPTRFAEPSVGFDLRELKTEECQCQLVELDFHEATSPRPLPGGEQAFLRVGTVPLRGGVSPLKNTWVAA